MNATEPFTQRLARRLIAYAGHTLQKNRAEWADAMRSELDYVPQGFAALRWSAGCLVASWMTRMRIMEIGSLKTTRISRVVLTLEMLLCFWGPTGGLITSVMIFGSYLPVGSPPLGFLLLTASLVGPLGLWLAFRAVVLERRAMSPRVTFVLSALATWTLIGNTLFALSVASPGYEFRGIILLAILPAAGAAHLIYMAKTDRRAPAIA